MAERGTVSNRMVQKIVAAIGVLGGEPRAAMAAAGLLPDALADPDGRLPHRALVALWREGERLTGDECLGIKVAELSRRAPDNVLAYAVQSCGTLDEALRRSIRYATLVHDALDLRLVVEGDQACVRLDLRHPLPTLRHGAECTLAMVTLFCRQWVAGSFALEEIRFRHGPPASGEAHARIFQAPVSFGCERDELRFDRALLDRPLRGCDPELSIHLERHLERMLARRRDTDEWLERVRSALGAQLVGGAADIRAVAARLRMSPRSLQRRLRASGSSFQALLDEERRDRSVSYLGDPSTSIAEVAFLVGFSEVASFHRAFKRWTGMTPAECRRRKTA